MNALEDYIFWSIPNKCWDCRIEYEKDKKRIPCERNGKCIITKREKTILNFEEYQIWNEFVDFMATGQILSNDRWRRDMIIKLKMKMIELQNQIGNKNG